MNTTRIISLRVTEEFYTKLHIYCKNNGIAISDWMSNQIEIANNQANVKRELLVLIKSLRRSRSDYSNINTDEVIEKINNCIDKNM